MSCFYCPARTAGTIFRQRNETTRTVTSASLASACGTQTD